jgi:hypothetical protein
MKPLGNIAYLTVICLISACGEQLVEFGDASGGGTARGGVGGSGGRTGGSGGRAGSTAVTAGEAGSGVAGSGALGAGGDGDGGIAGNVGGAAGNNGQAGNGGTPGSNGQAGNGELPGNGGEPGSGGEAGENGQAPFVVFTNPEDDDENVAVNKTITATFSESMKSTTLTANFTLTGPGLTPVPGMVDYTALGNVGSFDPDEDLAPETTFTATITSEAADSGGQPMADDHVWTFTTGTEAAQTLAQLPVELGDSSEFVILASAAITNIPTSDIVGDVGLFPDAGSKVSGFSLPASCPEITGTLYLVDATGPACATIDPVLLGDARLDAEVAYLNAVAAVRGTPQAISGDLNGLTLYPGLYESGTSLQISPGGFLYLDAQGDQDAVFIIRSATSITTEATSEVVLTKGAKAANVYWTSGSTVTLGTSSIMKGTLLASTSISLLTGANLEGRALNQGPAAAAITLDSCIVTLPLP